MATRPLNFGPAVGVEEGRPDFGRHQTRDPVRLRDHRRGSFVEAVVVHGEAQVGLSPKEHHLGPVPGAQLLADGVKHRLCPVGGDRSPSRNREEVIPRKRSEPISPL